MVCWNPEGIVAWVVYGFGVPGSRVYPLLKVGNFPTTALLYELLERQRGEL